MPPIIYCDRFPDCQNLVASPGLCPDCKRKAERQKKREWQWRGWGRAENNQDAKNGHKGNGANK